jgi:hypothetical protein
MVFCASPMRNIAVEVALAGGTQPRRELRNLGDTRV